MATVKYFVLACGLIAWPVAADPGTRKPRVEPQILASSPISATRGTRSTVELRGKGLAGASAVICDCAALTAEIKSIEEKSDEQKLKLEFVIGSKANRGVHTFRVVSPMGVTSPKPLLVHDEVTVAEESLPTEIEQSARRLPPAPIIVLGR